MAKRIRPARHYQRADNAARRLMLEGKPAIRRDLRAALGSLSVMVPTNGRLEMLFRNGRWREMRDDGLAWNHFREVLKRTFSRIAKVYETGADLGVRKINGSFHAAQRRVRFRKRYSYDFELQHYVLKADGDIFNFDMFDAATQDSLRRAQDALIVQLTEEARDTIERIVLSGALEGLSAEAIVADIRLLIGLTDKQAQAVINFRRMLQSLDIEALTRQLRNTTWDAVVLDAIERGEIMAAEVIDKMVQDYTENYLDYRAATIAQTESVRAVNKGLHDAYTQAIERGAIPADAVHREWELGDRPCPICESIPDNNPNGVRVGQNFMSDEGPVSDPPVHPNCMCSVAYITDISKVPEEESESGAYDTNVPVTGLG